MLHGGMAMCDKRKRHFTWGEKPHYNFTEKRLSNNAERSYIRYVRVTWWGNIIFIRDQITLQNVHLYCGGGGEIHIV